MNLQLSAGKKYFLNDTICLLLNFILWEVRLSGSGIFCLRSLDLELTLYFTEQCKFLVFRVGGFLNSVLRLDKVHLFRSQGLGWRLKAVLSAWAGGAWLRGQHLGGRGWKSMSLRETWAPQRIQAKMLSQKGDRQTDKTKQINPQRLTG